MKKSYPKRGEGIVPGEELLAAGRTCARAGRLVSLDAFIEFHQSRRIVERIRGFFYASAKPDALFTQFRLAVMDSLAGERVRVPRNRPTVPNPGVRIAVTTPRPVRKGKVRP